MRKKKGWAARKRADGLHDRIKAARDNVGMTQADLGHAVGVSRGAVTQWESGQTKDLRIENLFAVAQALKITLEELVFDTAPAKGVAEESGTYRVLSEETMRAMGILDRLPKEVRFSINQMIVTLAPLTNPNYQDWCREQDKRVSARPKRKEKET